MTGLKVLAEALAPPWSEAERLAALRGYGILDTPPERDFDDLTRLASQVLGAPVALMTLLDGDRQWHKSATGLDLRQLPLEQSVCARVIRDRSDPVIPDLSRDDRFAAHPLVAGEPGFRFYAGEILEAQGGLPLGALCVLDTTARPEGLTEQQRFTLRTLARQVMTQMELRRALAEQRRDGALHRQIVDGPADHAIIATDLEGRVTRWNAGAEALFGWTEAEMLGRGAGRILPPGEGAVEGAGEDGLAPAFREALAAGRSTGEGWHLRRDGNQFWASGALTPLRNEAGEAVGFVHVLRDRTERHRTAAALAAANERYRLAARATNDAIWDWDLRADAVRWNEALEAAYGHAPGAVRPDGAWWIGQIHPADRDRVRASLRAAIEGTGEGWTAEYRFRRADGSHADVFDRGFVIRDPAGRAVRMIGAMLDLSERHRSAAALRESESRYRNLFDSIDEGFCIIEFLDGPEGPASDYVHVEANPAYARHAGIPDVVGQRVRAMVPGEAAGWVELYGEVLRSGRPLRFERELIATGRHLELAAFRVEPPERRQVAVLFQDITARKQAEAALQRLNETLERRVTEAVAEHKLLADIVENTDAFVQAMDNDLRWIAINGAAAREFERIFGVRPKVGDALSDLLRERPGHLEAVRNIWNRALAGGPFVEIAEFGEPGPDLRSYEMRFNPLHDASGARIGAYQFVYDVTERLREQAQLRETEAALRQSQKMEAVGQLTGGLAHDFNNLLTGITGSLEMLQTRLAQGRLREVDRYVGAAQGAARRAASLTHRLLAFSRRQTLDPRPTDVNRLVAGMEELIRRTMGPAVTVEVVGAGGLWSSLVDPNQLENALLNLCINARDAMPGGGRLTIETANRWLDERAARERDLPPGQYLSLCVTDSGTGMAPEVVARAFDPFFTTKPMGQGTGLGLSMVYGFVRQSGGQVRIYTEPSQGTTMCLYLPRHYGEDADAEAAQPARAPRAGQGETVLVVDDEPTVRLLVGEVLEDLGYTTLEACDGASGLRVLQSEVPIDLLVTDVGLPGGMNGRQLADAARVARPGLKVLFITGYAENAAVGNGHLEPGMHVLTKPFPLESLAERIKALIDG